MRDEPRLGFFPGLSAATLARIAARLVHKRAPDGYTFFTQGEPADRLYLLRRGTVYVLDQDQRSHRPQVVEAGEDFGGFAFFTGGTHAVSAVAHGEVEVSELRRRELDQLLADDRCRGRARRGVAGGRLGGTVRTHRRRRRRGDAHHGRGDHAAGGLPQGGGVVGLSTLAGFLLAIYFNTI